MPTYIPPKKNVQLILYVGLISRATGQLQANPTLAVGDVTISLDGGAFGNIATLPTATPAGGVAVKVTILLAEMNADNVVVVFSDAADDEWDDLFLNLQTSSRQVNELALEGADADTLETLSDQLDLVALTGGDADTLETLSDQIDGVCSLGTGAITWTYTLTSTVFPNPPIADADVWVTTDLLGTNVIASGRTNAAGEVTFYLDPSPPPIYVWRQKSGWNFTNPDVEAV